MILNDLALQTTFYSFSPFIAFLIIGQIRRMLKIEILKLSFSMISLTAGKQSEVNRVGLTCNKDSNQISPITLHTELSDSI